MGIPEKSIISSKNVSARGMTVTPPKKQLNMFSVHHKINSYALLIFLRTYIHAESLFASARERTTQLRLSWR